MTRISPGAHLYVAEAVLSSIMPLLLSIDLEDLRAVSKPNMGIGFVPRHRKAQLGIASQSLIGSPESVALISNSAKSQDFARKQQHPSPRSTKE